MRVFSWIVGVLIAMAFSGCATPYQSRPAGRIGGYVDQKIDDQTWHVQFTGNGYTSGDMVHKYFLYRCAELTQHAGFKYFAIIPAALSGAVTPIHQPARGTGFDPRLMQKVAYRPMPIVVYGGGGVTSLSVSADIRMFNDDAVINSKVIGFDAGEIADQLGPYIHSEGKTSAEVPRGWIFEPGHAKVRAQDLLPTNPTKDLGT